MRLPLFFAAAFLAACTSRMPEPSGPTGVNVHRLLPGARVHFTAVKNGDTAVAGSFSDVTGRVDLAHFPELSGEIRINLLSAATGVDQRDKNVKAYFFEVSGPTGTTAYFVPTRFAGAEELPAPGTAVNGVLSGMLGFHGFSDAVTMAVALERDARGAFYVKSTAPLRFSIAAWSMADEKATLMEHCHHKNVDDMVSIALEAPVE